MRTFRALAVLTACALLTACGPSSNDIARAVGRNDVSDVSCTGAVGQPGYVCTFTLGNYQLTRRLVKNESGNWDVVY